MPRDYAILAKFDPVGRSEDFLKSIGKTDYVFSVYDNDVQINPSKQLRTVEGSSKLIQSVLKVILTKQGENFEDPNYGIRSDFGIGEKLLEDQYGTIRSGIIDALAYFNQLNSDNENGDEVIEEIKEVKVEKNIIDPRAIFIYLSLITVSGKTVQIIVPQVE